LAITRRWRLHFARRPGEFLEAARRLAGGFAVLLGRREFGRGLSDQTLVLGQTK
jgi:hypothetical protein